MTLLLVAVAFASFSADQIDRGTPTTFSDAPMVASQSRDNPQPAAPAAPASTAGDDDGTGDAQGGARATPSTSQAGQESADENGERRICRRIPVSRTHMYRRVCLTAEQWRDYDN